MKFSSSQKSDSGSAAVELVGFGILLQIPILLFAVSAVELQHRSFAVEAIARNAVRSFVLINDLEHTASVIAKLGESFSVDPSRLTWDASCTPDPTCLGGGTITLTVKYGDQVAVGYSLF